MCLSFYSLSSLHVCGMERRKADLVRTLRYEHIVAVEDGNKNYDIQCSALRCILAVCLDKLEL